MSETAQPFAGHGFELPSSPSDRHLQPATPPSEEALRPLLEVAAWLRESPNNAGYLSSDTYKLFNSWLERHTPAIASKLDAAKATLNTDNESIDLARLAALRSTEQQSGDIFSAYDIAYADKEVRELIDKFRDVRAEDGRLEVSNRAIHAIGATMLRAEYMKRLAEHHPWTRTPAGEAPFQTMFRQNILAIIQHAAWLESAAQPSSETPELYPVPPEEIAA